MRLLRYLRENVRFLTAGVLLTFLSSFGQTYFISLFSGEIRAEFSLSHGEWGGIYSLGTMTSAIVMVWAGALTDHLRVRILGAVVFGLLVAACLFMAFNNAAWLLPLVIFGLRFTGQGMTSHLAVVAMARWFVATRGKALAIAGLGFSVGEALLPILVVAVMALVDWRLIWVGAAGITLLGMPILLLLLSQERTPQAISQSSQATGMNGHHWTRMSCLRHWLFWLMVPALLGPSAFSTAYFFQQVYFAEVKGWAHIELVAQFPFFTVISIFSMIGFGWALDKVGTGRLMPFFQLPMVAAFLCFSYADGVAMNMLGLFFMALTAGANATLIPAFWAEFYGTRYIGAIKAVAAAIMVLGSAIGPGLTGFLIDFGIGLEAQYIGVALFFVFASILMMIGIRRAVPLLLVR